MEDLGSIRRRSYATSRHALIDGAVAMSAPVFDDGGTVVGALAVFGPDVRLRAAQITALAKDVQKQAMQVSRAMGCGAALQG